MLTAALDLSNLGSAVGSTTATTSNNASDPQASQDRFLKLLVAQINNQDPLNPMDNAQMTSQMAQINTVSGIQELNATLKGMADQVASTASLQGTTLIGRDALTEGNALGWSGAVAKGALSLSGPANQVYVDILGASGEVIDTVDLGARGAGQHGFEWNAGELGAGSAASFSVRTGDTAVTATPLSRVPVASVGLSGGAMNLHLQNGRSIGYDQALGFM